VFELNIVDHVRLNLTRTGENYTVHARAAERLARLTGRIRIGVLALLLAAAGSSVATLLTVGGRPVQIAAVVAASLAFAGYSVYVGWGFEGRVSAHRACAHNLWLVCERYRALLTEIQDGLLDRNAILRRRDELALETHHAYGLAFPLDHPAYEGLRQTGEDKSHPNFHDAPGDSLPASS
jgi:hypothetical protein